MSYIVFGIVPVHQGNQLTQIPRRAILNFYMRLNTWSGIPGRVQMPRINFFLAWSDLPIRGSFDEEIRAGPAEMDPFLFPAPLGYRCDPRVRLHFRCVGKTLPLRAKRRQQARRHHRTCSRQRLKEKNPDAQPPPPRSSRLDPQCPDIKLRMSCAITFTTVL